MLTYSLGDGYKPNKGYKLYFGTIYQVRFVQIRRASAGGSGNPCNTAFSEFQPSVFVPFAMEVLQTSQSYLSHVTYETELPTLGFDQHTFAEG